MSERVAHPSYLELDRHALGASTPNTAAHVAQCERCHRYLDQTGPAPEVPSWVEELGHERRKVRRGPVAPFAALALAACAVFFAWPREQPAYDTAKGAPSVAVYVNHQGKVDLWQGAPLDAGDRIRLEVAPEDLEHVLVLATPPDREWNVLYQGRLKAHERTLLPKAWALDGEREPERLLVMFSRSELALSAARALSVARDPRDVWVVRIELPKNMP